VLEHRDRLQSVLAAQSQIADVVVVNDRTVKAIFAGTDGDRAQLLQTLLAAELAVTDFHVVQEDLESIFLKMDYQRTS
jgi:ABC-2 type transport system ATP-binding protein